MLSCKDISHLASEHIDNNLPPLMKMKVKMHLFMCHKCRIFMKQFRTTVETVHAIKPNPHANKLEQETIELQVQALLKARQNIKSDDNDRS